MSKITINGATVVAGSITFPTFGAWAGDVELAKGDELASGPLALTVVVGDLTIKGTVVRQATFAGSRTARIVGGAAGWRRELGPKGYSHIAGVKLSSVLGDAARESGESINVTPDRTLGSHWAREQAKAENLLSLLLDGEWWIDNDGVTQMSDRDASPITTPFTVIGSSGGKGSFEIGADLVASWQPGRTFTANTVSGVQTISSVTIEATNEGKLRLHVLNTDGARERLRSDIRSIVRSELAALSFAGEWEYTIGPSLGMPGLAKTVDCTPTDSRMPALTRVPLKGLGAVVAPISGTACRIRFVNCDPSRPEVCSIDGTTEHVMTTEACVLLIYNVLQTLTLVNAGPWFGVAMQPLLSAAILTAMAAQSVPAPPGLVAQIAAAAAQASAMAAGTAPSSTTGPFAAPIAALATKTLDVSGLFPSLGIPAP